MCVSLSRHSVVSWGHGLTIDYWDWEVGRRLHQLCLLIVSSLVRCSVEDWSHGFPVNNRDGEISRRLCPTERIIRTGCSSESCRKDGLGPPIG